MFLDLQRLKSDKFLCQSFSENRSIKSPARTNAPPEIADTTTQKIDPVVISFHIQLALDAEFINAFAQRRARDAEQFRGVNLVVVRFLERLDHEFALDG